MTTCSPPSSTCIWRIRRTAAALLLLCHLSWWSPRLPCHPAAAGGAGLVVGVGALEVSVNNGYEMHAAISSPDVDTVVLLADVSMSLNTCPAPHADPISLTNRRTQLTITSDLAGPYPVWDCGLMPYRFLLTEGVMVTLRHIQLRNCSGEEEVQFFRKAAGVTLVLEDVVQDRGRFCAPVNTTAQRLLAAPRPSALDPSKPQVLKVAEAGTNWCIPGNTLPNVPRLQPPSQPLCNLQALLFQDVAEQQPAAATNRGPWTLVWRNSVQVCPNPLPASCLSSRGEVACATEAYSQANPDNIRMSPVEDGYQFHDALVQLVSTPSIGIILIANVTLDLVNSPPTQDPPVLDRDVRIEADGRGPRLYLDCGLLQNRFKMAPNRRLSFRHLVLVNCTISTPFDYIEMSTGGTMLVNDTILWTTTLCVPLRDKFAELLHSPRSGATPGVQHLNISGPGNWCNVTTDAPVLPVTGGDNGTGPGGAPITAFANDYLADYLVNDSVTVTPSTLDDAINWAIPEPTSSPYYFHPSWLGQGICARAAAQLLDFSTDVPVGGYPPALPAAPGGNQTVQEGAGFADATGAKLASVGTFTYIAVKSAWVQCPRPLLNCTDVYNSYSCLAGVYQSKNPDNDPALVAAAQQQRDAVKGVAGGDSNHGVKVVLPAVLGSIGGLALLLGLAALLAKLLLPPHKQPWPLAAARKRRHGGKGVADTGSPASSDPHWTPRSGDTHITVVGGGTSSSGSMRDSARSVGMAPEGIVLGVLLGAGSYGRVYRGTWKGKPVAVKIVTHAAAEEPRITRELALTLPLEHPHLVRTLHFARMSIRPSPNATPLTPLMPSSAGSDLSLPPGAVGVFNVGSDWTVGAPHASPVCDMETWMVLELMDRGTLAQLVRGGAFVVPTSRQIKLESVLLRARDVASGMTYLHARQVCHGDLKCENVLVKSDPSDPDGLVAKVADFGLSRALAAGQSHLSTKRYGTVTHMPPELLSTGKLTMAADVYSFGIMMWELVASARPFEGMHHGEIIHKVVSQDLRPGPWPHGTPQEYILVAEACWQREPARRPPMQRVLATLTTLLGVVTGRGEAPAPAAAPAGV